MPITNKTPKEIHEERVERLVQEFGHIKVNLTRCIDRSENNGEGVWAVPCDAHSKAMATSDYSKGSPIEVFLCNEPFEWPCEWGTRVFAKTRGANRPCAYMVDNGSIFPKDGPGLNGLADEDDG